MPYSNAKYSGHRKQQLMEETVALFAELPMADSEMAE